MANSPHRYNGTGVHTVKIYTNYAKGEDNSNRQKIRVPKEGIPDSKMIIR